jgi:hypothetical protein
MRSLIDLSSPLVTLTLTSIIASTGAFLCREAASPPLQVERPKRGVLSSPSQEREPNEASSDHAARATETREPIADHTDDASAGPLPFRHARLLDVRGALSLDSRAGRDEPDRDRSLDVATWGADPIVWSEARRSRATASANGWSRVLEMELDLAWEQLRILAGEHGDRPDPTVELRRGEQRLRSFLQEQLGAVGVARLHQLAWRRSCDRHTLYQMLAIGSLGEDLAIDNPTRDELSFAIEAEIERLRSEILATERALLNEIAERLEPPHAAALLERYGDDDLWSRMPLIDFDRIDDRLQLTAFKRQSVAEFYDDPAAVSDPVKFGMGSSPLPNRSPRDLARLEGLFSLDADQRTELARRREELEYRFFDLSHELERERRRSPKGARVDELRREMEQLRRRTGTLVDELIDVPQRLESERIEDLIAFRYWGMTQMLVSGSVGYDLGLTEPERDRIVARVDALRRRLNESRRRLIDEHERRLTELLDESTRASLTATLGEPPVEFPPIDPARHVATLERAVESLPSYWSGDGVRPNDPDRELDRPRLRLSPSRRIPSR